MKEGKGRVRAEEGTGTGKGYSIGNPVEGKLEPAECFSFSSVQALLDYVTSCTATEIHLQ